MTEPENRLTTNNVARRVGMLRRASDELGQVELASAIGIEPRSLRAKLGVERGVSDADLALTAAALVDRARALIGHADVITAHLTRSSEASCPTA